MKKEAAIRADSEFLSVVPVNQTGKLEKKVFIAKDLMAPVFYGQNVGKIYFYLNGKLLRTIKVSLSESVPKVTFSYTFKNLFLNFLGINQM